jgi:hypothetical protein
MLIKYWSRSWSLEYFLNKIIILLKTFNKIKKKSWINNFEVSVLKNLKLKKKLKYIYIYIRPLK